MDGIQAGHDNTKSSLWNRLHWTSNHYFSRGNLENETILSSVHFNFSLGWLFSTIFLDFQRARQYCAPPFSWIHLHSSISQKNIQTFISLKISPPSWKIILKGNGHAGHQRSSWKASGLSKTCRKNFCHSSKHSGVIPESLKAFSGISLKIWET